MNRSKIGKNSRRKGFDFERSAVKYLKLINVDAKTSRAGDRSEDALGGDILCNIPFRIQCKNKNNQPNFKKVLDEMKDDDKWNIVFYKRTGQRGANNELAVLSLESFLEIVEILKSNDIL